MIEVYHTAKELHTFLIYVREIGEMYGNGHEKHGIRVEEAKLEKLSVLLGVH